MAQQQIQLNVQQLFSITEMVLRDTQIWAEKKSNETNNHSRKARDAATSIHHTRLLLGLHFRELLARAAKPAPLPNPPPFDQRDADVARLGK